MRVCVNVECTQVYIHMDSMWVPAHFAHLQMLTVGTWRRSLKNVISSVPRDWRTFEGVRV